MAENNQLITYSEALSAGCEAVGQKAYNTALCHHSGFLVPPGVVVSGDVFLAARRGEILDDVFAAVAAGFSGAPMVIVRSSALDEDRAAASFAGQYLSVICENTAPDIKRAAQACWRSYESQPAAAYRKAMTGREESSPRAMPLLIQKTVRADCSGVCFSADPKRTRDGVVVINAVNGLGETLSGGEVAADHYEYETGSEAVSSSFTGKQTRWRSFDHPGELGPLPDSLSGKAVLNQRQIREIARLAEAVARILKYPVDIEWAYEGHSLFLLQARPITAARKGAPYQRWTRDNVADVIPDAVTPLTWSLVDPATNNGFNEALRRMGFSFGNIRLFDLFEGRAYFNATAFQDILAQASASRRHPVDGVRKAFRHFLNLAGLPLRIRRLERAFEKRLSACGNGEPGVSLGHLKKYLEDVMALHIRIAVLMQLDLSIIRALSHGRSDYPEGGVVLDRLLGGLKANESTAASEALMRLCGKMKKDETLIREILDCPDQDIDSLLSKKGGEIEAAWRDFLRRFGHQSLKEFEIYYPRWSEDRSFLTAMMKQYLETASAVRTRAVEKKRAAASLPFPRRLILLFYLHHVRLCSLWREAVKQKLVKIMARARSQALQFSQNMSLAQPQDVFFLTGEQIAAAKGSSLGPEAIQMIEDKKTQWHLQNTRGAYQEIRVYEDGRRILVPHLSSEDRADLRGIGMSSGQYTGTAKIVFDPGQIAGFHQGDVLVVRSTNPSWTPLFTLAGAVIADMGNYLSHGAIIARELGIPAVGNLFFATETIRDGQRVFVDGDEGSVRILEGCDHE